MRSTVVDEDTAHGLTVALYSAAASALLAQGEFAEDDAIGTALLSVGLRVLYEAGWPWHSVVAGAQMNWEILEALSDGGVWEE